MHMSTATNRFRTQWTFYQLLLTASRRWSSQSAMVCKQAYGCKRRMQLCRKSRLIIIILFVCAGKLLSPDPERLVGMPNAADAQTDRQTDGSVKCQTATQLRSDFFLDQPIPTLESFGVDKTYKTIHVIDLCNSLLRDERERRGNRLELKNWTLLVHLFHTGLLENILDATCSVFLSCLTSETTDISTAADGTSQDSQIGLIGVDSDSDYDGSSSEDCGDTGDIEMDSEPAVVSGSSCKLVSVDEKSSLAEKERSSNIKSRRTLAIDMIDAMIDLWITILRSLNSNESPLERALREKSDKFHFFEAAVTRKGICVLMVKYLCQMWAHDGLYLLPPMTVQNVLELLQAAIKTLQEMKASAVKLAAQKLHENALLQAQQPKQEQGRQEQSDMPSEASVHSSSGTSVPETAGDQQSSEGSLSTALRRILRSRRNSGANHHNDSETDESTAVTTATETNLTLALSLLESIGRAGPGAEADRLDIASLASHGASSASLSVTVSDANGMSRTCSAPVSLSSVPGYNPETVGTVELELTIEPDPPSLDENEQPTPSSSSSASSSSASSSSSAAISVPQEVTRLRTRRPRSSATPPNSDNSAGADTSVTSANTTATIDNGSSQVNQYATRYPISNAPSYDFLSRTFSDASHDSNIYNFAQFESDRSSSSRLRQTSGQSSAVKSRSVLPEVPSSFKDDVIREFDAAFMTILLKRIYTAAPQVCLRVIQNKSSTFSQSFWNAEETYSNISVTREFMTVTVLNQMLKCLENSKWSESTLKIVQLTILLQRAKVVLQEDLNKETCFGLYGLLHAILLVLSGKVSIGQQAQRPSAANHHGNSSTMLIFTRDRY